MLPLASDILLPITIFHTIIPASIAVNEKMKHEKLVVCSHWRVPWII